MFLDKETVTILLHCSYKKQMSIVNNTFLLPLIIHFSGKGFHRAKAEYLLKANRLFTLPF